MESEAEEASNSTLPNYWANRVASDREQPQERSKFDVVLYLDADKHAIFDELLQSTYAPTATQDRPCPASLKNHVHVQGGCACVRPGGTPGLPTSYRVRRVMRVEDAGMWGRYVRKREALRSLRADQLPLPRLDQAVDTEAVVARYPEVFQPLDEGLNEAYLWHGTFVRHALSIAAEDFSINLAGDNRGTMYGRGVYFAESSTKADEYAKDEPGGYYEGAFVMLLCRVVLGNYHYTKERDEDAGGHTQSGQCDSTVGDRRASVNTFREFVLYDTDQMYPEYVVLYNRIHKDDNMDEVERLTKLPYHMELPVYWRNFHKNPRKECFDEQHPVQRRTHEALQQLVLASMKGRSKLERVRRVENSKVWLSYVDFKVSLKQKLHQEALKAAGKSEADLEAGPSVEEVLHPIPPDDDYKTFGIMTLCGCGCFCFWIPLVLFLGAAAVDPRECEWSSLDLWMKFIGVFSFLAQPCFMLCIHYAFKIFQSRSCYKRRSWLPLVVPVLLIIFCSFGLHSARGATESSCKRSDEGGMNPVLAHRAVAGVVLAWAALNACFFGLILVGDDEDSTVAKKIPKPRLNLFKQNLRCVPAEEMDGDAEQGQVTTFQHLKELGVGGKLDEAICVANLEDSLNEHLLWHGTSKEAAESIVHSDFRIPENPTHGFRFGAGAYFAEDLNKSLSYASAEGGVKFVLLCRVTCGQYYYTERAGENTAHTTAKANGKNCILANPGKTGPREFIVLGANQVYPEFILEISTKEEVDA